MRVENELGEKEDAKMDRSAIHRPWRHVYTARITKRGFL